MRICTPTANSVTFELTPVRIRAATGGAALVDGRRSCSAGCGDKTFDSILTARSPPAACASRHGDLHQDEVAMRWSRPSCPRGMSLTPRNVGRTRAHGERQHELDTSATTLDQTGQPGTRRRAIPIVIVPGRGEDVAQAVSAAIAAAVAQGKLVEVTSEAFGAYLFLDGMDSVTGLTVDTLTSIHDLAGNDLRPNRPDGTTRFTILTGLGTDYGDAPAVYPVLREDNGAGHRIVPGFHLGTFVDAEPDGQPSALASADLSDDGVVFAGSMTAGQNAVMNVVASAAGFLDVWFDANGDGDWNDVGEKIFSSHSVAAGSNMLTFRSSRPPWACRLHAVPFSSTVAWHGPASRKTVRWRIML